MPRLSAFALVTIGLRVAAAAPSGCRTFRARSLAPAASKWQIARRATQAIQRVRWASAVARSDVFHSTYFTVSPVRSVPAVVTVYDMIVESFPDYYESYEGVEHLLEKQAAIRAASTCICISESTAKELVAFYPEVKEKVRVIHPGADHLPVAAGETPDQTGDRYVMYVGGRSRYKNFRALLEAVAAPMWPQGLFLVVIGAPFSRSEELFISRLGIADTVRHGGQLSDVELARAYRGARACIYPSLMEGFGIPVLEAQASGCPVVCSDIPVFREVGGESVLFFDPRSPHSIAEAVGTTVDPVTARRSREAGFENAKRFTWAKCAERTLAVYKELAC